MAALEPCSARQKVLGLPGSCEVLWFFFFFSAFKKKAISSRGVLPLPKPKPLP